MAHKSYLQQCYTTILILSMSIELFRLLPCMDFHLLLQGGSYSFCTKLLCPILLNGSGLKQIVCHAPSTIIFLQKKRLIRFYSSIHNVFNSSRIVARSIALNESQFDDHPESDNSSSDIAQSVTNNGIPSTSLSVSALSRLRGRVHALWQWVLQKWPSVRFFFPSW